MPYENVATSKTPGYIVFAIDMSGSMARPMKKGITRIDVVRKAIHEAFKILIRRSTRGNIVSPRYKIAIIGYREKVFDFYNGFQPIDEILNIGLPKFFPYSKSNTSECFKYIKNLIVRELNDIPENIKTVIPAPIVIHITDGEMTEDNEDFEPSINDIRKISLPDGNVLVEHIYISDNLDFTKGSPEFWPGFKASYNTGNPYANKLLQCTSVFPETYRRYLRELGGTSLEPGALMFFPGVSPEYIFLGVKNLPICPLTSTASPAYFESEVDKEHMVSNGLHNGDDTSSIGRDIEEGSQTKTSKDEIEIKENDAKTEFKTTLAFPKLFSKRFSSTLLVYIYPKSISRKVNLTLEKQIQKLGKSIDDYKRSDNPVDIEVEAIVIVKIESPGIEFQSPVVVKIKEKETKIVFIAKPVDNCQVGKHMAKLSICEKDTEVQLFSIPFEINVIDFVFDHISRPFIYNLAAAFSGLGAVLMFVLTFLGQIDTTFGLASGTTAGIVTATLYLRFASLYQRLHSIVGVQ